VRLIAFDVPGSGLPVGLRNKKTQKGGDIQRVGSWFDEFNGDNRASCKAAKKGITTAAIGRVWCAGKGVRCFVVHVRELAKLGVWLERK